MLGSNAGEPLGQTRTDGVWMLFLKKVTRASQENTFQIRQHAFQFLGLSEGKIAPGATWNSSLGNVVVGNQSLFA